MTENAETQMSFEQALARLEQVVQALDTGDQSLEESLKLFEEGNTLKQLCLQQLREAEAVIEQYSEDANQVQDDIANADETQA